MQIDGVLPLPAGDDDESLFGSPPPSPARGRSPKLALPAGPVSAENVGTIALPGSQYSSELAIDPAVLLLNSPPPSRNLDTPSTTTRLTPLSTSSSSHKPASSRGSSRAPRNSQNGKGRSTTPRPPPPTINFPDPDEPLPPNFLRGQQALLGHAGRIGGLDPSALSTRYHRGTTSQNPIIVEDELDPPLLGKKRATLNPSSLPSPSSDEVVSSLVKQRNIFPVLESLLRLVSGTGVSGASPVPTPSSHSGSSSPGPNQGWGPPLKRRRLNSVPAGAADWDVPYPFPQGEGPSQYRLHWEKERLKQLLSQLVVLIKGAKRSAAARTYLQQHADSWSAIPNPPQPPSQTSYQQQSIPGASPCEQYDTQICHPEIRDVSPTPTISENIPHQVPQSPAAIPQTASLDDLIASLYDNSIPHVSSPFDLTSSSPSSEFIPHHPPLTGSYSTPSDALSPDLEQFWAMLHHASSQCMTSSVDSPGLAIPPGSSASADGVPRHENLVVASAIPDSVIDPTLLGESINHISETATPTLLQSPVASTSSVFDPQTPREDLCLEPDVYRSEQGTSQLSSRRFHIPQALVNAIAEDPITAATLLLQMATTASSQAFQSKAQSLPSPTSRFLSVEPQSSLPPSSSQPLAISTATTTPTSSRASSAAPRPGLPASANASTAQILSLQGQRRLGQAPPRKIAPNKRELIQRAQERRQQLLAELEKAKVELWEATIEQGVLSHLMKDHGRL
ncbi:hypothetical protein BJV78DRAFT_1220435 [Lactifluus subvellereus]|nr:hypothetical protein BJV78DRAFT_1220435 [Lactifluus subvellereus]